MDGRTARWMDIVDMAHQAEAVGFDSIWLPDHLLMQQGEESVGMWECLTMLSALAAATSRIAITPGAGSDGAGSSERSSSPGEPTVTHNGVHGSRRVGVSPRPRDRDMPEQLRLALPAPAPPEAKPKTASTRSAEEAATIAVARRTKPSVTPGHVKLTLTLDMPRALVERVSARAIREGKNLEAVIMEILGRA